MTEEVAGAHGVLEFFEIMGRYTDHRPDAAACRRANQYVKAGLGFLPGKETHYFSL
jgi:hypothetical protein